MAETRDVNVRLNVQAGDTSGAQAAARAAGGGGGGGLGPEAYGRVAAGIGQVQQAAQGGVGGLISLAGSISRVVPVAGVAAAAAGLIVGGIQAVGGALRELGPSLAEARENMQAMTGVLREGRQTGQTTAEAFRTAFRQRQDVISDLIAAQNRSDRQAQDMIVRREQTRARAEQAQAEAFQPEFRAQQAAVILQQEMERYRAGGFGRARAVGSFARAAFGAPVVGGGAAELIDRLWVAAGNRPEDMPQELRHIDPAALTPQRVQELSQFFSARAVTARAQVQATTGLLRAGGMVSLRTAAPERPDTGFRVQTGDILTLSDVIQQEAMRDQRQQNQFDQLMLNLDQWRAEMRRIGQPVVW